jgi:hypothetical protein
MSLMSRNQTAQKDRVPDEVSDQAAKRCGTDKYLLW